MFFACIYIPDFILQSAMRAEPKMRTEPAGILDGKPSFAVVIAVNQQAKTMGLCVGMSKAQAEEIGGGIQFWQRSTAHETAAHQALLDLALAFSPRIEDSAADTVILDLQGLMQVFGSFENLARGVGEQGEKFGLRVNVAIGSNPDASRLGARGFEGVTIFVPKDQAERLGRLPVSALAAGEGIEETLEYWGIRTCKALAALPREELSERLGQEGLLLQELARGTRQRALIPTTPTLNFEEAIELDNAVAELEPLAFVFSRMLGQLCERQVARGLAPIAIRLKMQLERADEQIFETAPEMRRKALKPKKREQTAERLGSGQQDSLVYEHTLRLPLPMRDSQALLRLWRLHLEAHPPASPVIKVEMAAEPATPRVLQAGLFTPALPDPEKLEITMARMEHLVGTGNIGAAELTDTHRPLAFRMKRFNSVGVGEEAKARVKKKAAKATQKSSRSQLGATAILRVFHPALPAQVEVGTYAPVRVCFSGAWGEVMAASGPWRSSGEWWTSAPWDQDEWDLEIEFQATEVMAWRAEKAERPMRAIYRITRERVRDTWFIQGVYD
jgi:protein ImuB